MILRCYKWAFVEMLPLYIAIGNQPKGLISLCRTSSCKSPELFTSFILLKSTLDCYLKNVTSTCTYTMYGSYLWPFRIKQRDYSAFYRSKRRYKLHFPTWWKQGRPREHWDKRNSYFPPENTCYFFEINNSNTFLVLCSLERVIV